jgi:exosortase C (VPDSG-CTERM-specific)
MDPLKTDDAASMPADIAQVHSGPALRRSPLGRQLGLILFTAALCGIFAATLSHWLQFALSKERNTYLLLVPVISGYLIWIKRREIHGSFSSSATWFLLPIAIGIVATVSGRSLGDPIDRLSLQFFGFLNFLIAGCFLFIGGSIMRQIAFPLAFLVFAVPMPTLFVGPIEKFLQYGSAETTYWMLSLTPMPMLREGLVFKLPGISLQVAQECSGYNSSFSLLMVSAVAGYLFLQSSSRRAVLAFVVLPLALLRNAFRITTLAFLCVYVNPELIDSYIHHNGGPIFFALSLIPFFMLLWGLRKSEIKKSKPSSFTHEQP